MINGVSNNVFSMAEASVEKEDVPKVEESCCSWLVSRITALVNSILNFISYIFCCGFFRGDQTDQTGESESSKEEEEVKPEPVAKREIKIPDDLGGPERKHYEMLVEFTRYANYGTCNLTPYTKSDLLTLSHLYRADKLVVSYEAGGEDSPAKRLRVGLVQLLLEEFTLKEYKYKPAADGSLGSIDSNSTLYDYVESLDDGEQLNVTLLKKKETLKTEAILSPLDQGVIKRELACWVLEGRGDLTGFAQGDVREVVFDELEKESLSGTLTQVQTLRKEAIKTFLRQGFITKYWYGGFELGKLSISTLVDGMVKSKQEIDLPDPEDTQDLDNMAWHAPVYEESGFHFGDVSNHQYWRNIINYKKMSELYKEVADLGAHVEPYIRIEEDRLRFGVEEATRDSYTIELAEGLIYPMCTGGTNRSQCLRYHLIDSGIPESRIVEPHGLSESVDPTFTTHKTPLEGSMRLKKMNGAKSDLVEVDRVKRFGEDGFVHDGEYFEEHLWKRIIENGGTVVVFGTAVSAAMIQLVKVAKKEALELSRVKIVAIEAIDPFRDEGVKPYPALLKLYQAFERIEFKDSDL